MRGLWQSAARSLTLASDKERLNFVCCTNFARSQKAPALLEALNALAAALGEYTFALALYSARSSLVYICCCATDSYFIK
jgi:hypothetical protein